MDTWWERRLGMLLAVVSAVWAFWHVYAGQISAAYLRFGPMQLFMAGLLMWIHGKYRRAVEVNRA